MAKMNQDVFIEACNEWHEVAVKLAIAYTVYANTKHELEIEKAKAWADGQIKGPNADARKAALYIIVEPFKKSLIDAEDAVMKLEVQERYLRSLVDYGIWQGINNPNAWQGLRSKIDAYPQTN